MAWDAADLLPGLQEKYGDFVIPVVLAHEFGYAIRQRSGYFDQNKLTVSSELQADCFAGGWSKHAQNDGVFQVSSGDLDNSLAGILDLRDSPGTNVQDPSAHGSGFDRVSAFQDGYDNGAEKCKEYEDVSWSPPAIIIPSLLRTDGRLQMRASSHSWAYLFGVECTQRLWSSPKQPWHP